MRGFAVAVLLSLFIVPGSAFAGSTLKVGSHKGKTTIKVHTKGKPVKLKIKS